MRASAAAWSLIAGLVSTAVPLHAQRIEAGVAVGGGPVAGHLVIREGYSSYRRPPARRVVVVERPRIVVVERVHRHHSARHWAHRGYRPLTLYYRDGRYYDRWAGHPRGVRTVVVWERNGRFYEDCGDDIDGITSTGMTDRFPRLPGA
ncbi:MAG: hypothetical protein H0T50_03850 [Gemmatimonadales bacterium]|nr:hypothetical protein [Gemmatimonadales bacterium]